MEFTFQQGRRQIINKHHINMTETWGWGGDRGSDKWGGQTKPHQEDGLVPRPEGGEGGKELCRYLGSGHSGRGAASAQPCHGGRGR